MTEPKKTTLIIGIGGEKPEADPHEDGLTIPVPDGFMPPDGVEEGETFQVMADVKMVDGGLLIEKLDGKALGDSDKAPAEPDNDDDPDDEGKSPSKPTLMSSWKDLMKDHK